MQLTRYFSGPVRSNKAKPLTLPDLKVDGGAVERHAPAAVHGAASRREGALY